MKNMLFISHANPEDNEFSLWLALQLAKEGYPVWCDLTKLLGGEDFWKDIETAIRDRTVKFIYVLSETSNSKNGPLQELQVAHNVARDSGIKDFIIPLLIDDLPHNKINIQLSRINAISFKVGWAKGLKILLEKLEQDNIQKTPQFNPEAVTLWWRNQFSAEHGVLDIPEDYLSNWFPLLKLPEHIYFHALSRKGIGKLEVNIPLPFPAFQNARYLVSFAKSDDFIGKLGNSIFISESGALSLTDFLGEGSAKYAIDNRQARDFIVRLLKMAWEQFIVDRELPVYELSNGAKCFYFFKDMLKDDKADFVGVDGKKTYRSVIGYKTVKMGVKRFWHFGLQAKPLAYPYMAYVIKPHVLFSDDGEKIWESKLKLHAARRSQCKNWWNKDWRDKILASLNSLADESGLIEIKTGSDTNIQMSASPLLFNSPVSYADPEAQTIEEDEEIDRYDDPFEDEEDGDEL